MQGLLLRSRADAALRDLLRELERRGYDFVPPTPATHRRVLARGCPARPGLRDILGWSRPFERAAAPGWLLDALEAAGALLPEGERLKSAVRVARLKGRLYLHSAFPTDAPDSVFFGPDSYRFADFVERELAGRQAVRIADVGGGAGVGAIVAADLCPGAEVLLTDINPAALRLARINAAHAGVAIEAVQTNALDRLVGDFDLVIANPPYMADSKQLYRDGGGPYGARLSSAWAAAALARLTPGGRLLLYTGSAILDGGRDELKATLDGIAAEAGAGFDYRELDPDVFGEELERPGYAEVERIAAVACVLTRAT